jgi:hypothetical protein
MSEPEKTNSQFRLKNLETANLSQVLTEHQSSFIKIVLLLGVLIIGGLMFNAHRAKEQDLLSQVSLVQQKLDVIKARDAAIKDLNGYKSSLPKKLNEFELIALISDYAKLNHVTITSLSPAEGKDMGMYDVINVSFNATCDGFKDMVFFLSKIEKSTFPLRINVWSGRQEAKGKLNFAIEISAVLIHI